MTKRINTKKTRKNIGGNNWQKGMETLKNSSYWKQRVKGPQTRRLRRASTIAQKFARRAAALRMTKK